jgi:hypothetical protein
MIKLTQVKAQPNFRLFLKFEDGTEGTIDLSNTVGKGVFKELSNPVIFASAHIDAESGAVAWGDRIDLCPDSLYMQITGKSLDEFRRQLVAPDHAIH